jgi:3-oxoacyl-[acyl-carrier protein] reductase
MELSDRVAIITGSGRGIGKTIAVKLAEMGADIVINDIGEQTAVDAVSDEIKALGRRSIAVIADISTAEGAKKLVDSAIAGLGKVDIMVNNAGITRDTLIMRMSDDDWDKVIAVNLRSVFLCTRAVVRPMTQQRWGRIINMASVVGIAGNAGQANYAASKAGIIGLTKTVAKEVASRNVTVNAIAPGFIETAMTKELRESWVAEIKKRIPMGTVGQPEDVADAVAFLASERARYITGHVLNVDGGLGGL